MESRYARNVPALSEEDCQLLQEKRILIVGCGGLGGHLIDQLARIGVGSLRVVDGDVFEESNLNRQILSDTTLLGTRKVDAAAARVQRINPTVQVESAAVFMTEENADRLLSGCHVVLDGLDTIDSRRIVSRACAKAGLPYVYGAVSGWVAQAAVSLPGDGLVERLYPEEMTIQDKSVLSFTPAVCAAMQVSLCVKLLLGRPVEYRTLYYYDLMHQEFEVIPMG